MTEGSWFVAVKYINLIEFIFCVFYVISSSNRTVIPNLEFYKDFKWVWGLNIKLWTHK